MEVQGTAEGKPFDREELNQLLDLAQQGCKLITAAQLQAVTAPPQTVLRLRDGDISVN